MVDEENFATIINTLNSHVDLDTRSYDETMDCDEKVLPRPKSKTCER
jgi:hypothetical protein